MKTQQIDAPQDLPVKIMMQPGRVYTRSSKHCQPSMSATPKLVDFSWSALIWITKEGATWRSLPKVYGYWNAIYRRFGRWCDAGVFEKLHEHFHAAGDFSALLMDSTIVRGPFFRSGGSQKNGGQQSEALGRSRGGFTTKLNAAVNDAFLPLRFTLTAGARHDVTQAPALMTGYRCQYIIADAAYDSDALRDTIVAQGAVAVIKPRKNRVEERLYDKEVYKRRNVIERFFHRLKQYRRVAHPL